MIERNRERSKESKMRTNKQLADGRIVVARQRAQIPHPHPRQNGKLVTCETVNEVLLETGETVFECDYAADCTHVGSNARSVAAHQTSHSLGKHNSLYPDETLRLIIRLVKTAIRDYGTNGYSARVADDLNRRGIPPARGTHWTRGMVNSLYRHWSPTIKVRVPSGAERARSVQRKQLHTTPMTVESQTDDVTNTAIHDLRLLINLAEGVLAIVSKQQPIDPTIVKKAELWDQMQELMRR
jgi:hypothetical protein